MLLHYLALIRTCPDLCMFCLKNLLPLPDMGGRSADFDEIIGRHRTLNCSAFWFIASLLQTGVTERNSTTLCHTYEKWARFVNAVARQIFESSLPARNWGSKAPVFGRFLTTSGSNREYLHNES